jgi:hypothetical protein
VYTVPVEGLWTESLYRVHVQGLCTESCTECVQSVYNLFAICAHFVQSLHNPCVHGSWRILFGFAEEFVQESLSTGCFLKPVYWVALSKPALRRDSCRNLCPQVSF